MIFEHPQALRQRITEVTKRPAHCRLTVFEDTSAFTSIEAGSVLQQVVGKGRHSLHDIRLRPSEYPDFGDTLMLSDMSLRFRHRVANLRKLFPHISPALNEILMRFSVGCTDPDRDVDTLLADLRALFPSGRRESGKGGRLNGVIPLNCTDQSCVI